MLLLVIVFFLLVLLGGQTLVRVPWIPSIWGKTTKIMLYALHAVTRQLLTSYPPRKSLTVGNAATPASACHRVAGRDLAKRALRLSPG